jgi:preprotein translocase subunit SecF
MATTGTLDVNLTPYSNMTNNVATLGEQVTDGIADQGAVIGAVIGVIIAIGLLFGLVFFGLGKIMEVVRKTKGIKGA